MGIQDHLGCRAKKNSFVSPRHTCANSVKSFILYWRVLNSIYSCISFYTQNAFYIRLNRSAYNSTSIAYVLLDASALENLTRI